MQRFALLPELSTGQTGSRVPRVYASRRVTDLLSSSTMSGLAVVMATSVGRVAGGDSQIL